MRFHLTFSLIMRTGFVITGIVTTVLMPMILISGCGAGNPTSFTETVYSSVYSTVQVTDPAVAPREIQPETTEDPGSGICVFVCGAVNCEGVYELPQQARVIDAVEAAGGYSDDADRNYVNQAEYVYDTQRIEIPTKEEAERLREAVMPYDGDAGAEDSRIDLNSADKQELTKIPGIGESKAERIIEYRQAHGRFSSPEEVMNVNGIGSGVYEKMKDHITVR